MKRIYLYPFIYLFNLESIPVAWYPKCHPPNIDLRFSINSTGVYVVPCNLIFLPTLIFLNLIFFCKISVPFPSFLLDNLPYSLNIIEQMILLPLTLFSTWYSTPKPLNYLPLFKTWNSSLKVFINPPPSRGMRNFIHPWFSINSIFAELLFAQNIEKQFRWRFWIFGKISFTTSIEAYNLIPNIFI